MVCTCEEGSFKIHKDELCLERNREDPLSTGQGFNSLALTHKHYLPVKGTPGLPLNYKVLSQTSVICSQDRSGPGPAAHN